MMCRVSCILVNWTILCYFWMLVTLLMINVEFSIAKHSNRQLTSGQRAELMRYARATWKCMVALTNPSGITADRMNEDGKAVSYTTITDIASYMWSVLAADQLKLITYVEATKRLNTTLQTLYAMKKYKGFLYNYYNIITKEPTKLEVSSVDSGWIATALILVKHYIPKLRTQAVTLLNDMNFRVFYNASKPGCLCREFSSLKPIASCGTYCYLNSETRIANYIGIGLDQIPASQYFQILRTEPADCKYSWTETMPEGVNRTYLGITVFEGYYKYRGMKIVPSWGGSMFEALMVPLFVPETEWGQNSWAKNHRRYAKAHIVHGLDEAKYQVWGFSPAYNPSGGYKEYGVDAIGIYSNGYYSNNDNTSVNRGFPSCGEEPQPDPPPSAYTNGVVTPHASFLALPFWPGQAMANLKKLRNSYGMFGKYGFYDSVNVQTGVIAKQYIALDQGMAMAVIVNALNDNILHKYFTLEPGMVKNLRPLMNMEQFA